MTSLPEHRRRRRKTTLVNPATWCKVRLLLLLLAAAVSITSDRAAAQTASSSKPLILAHYMPWYAAKPLSQSWGWHWTMNTWDPDQVVQGKRQIASHYYPQIGPYDSGDPQLIEYHLLLMKLAGIDGVIVDWYGLQPFRDYAVLHRNTQRLVDQITRLEMKFAICYEDQTIPALVKASRLTNEKQVEHAAAELNWLSENWFARDSYVRVDKRPVLLSFGQTGLTDQQWSDCLARITTPVAYFSQHHRRTAAIGAFDWPIPKQGLAAISRFETNARGWKQAIPVAFPRFVDIYAEAKVHESWGTIADQDGATFRESMDQALTTDASLIQIATWNDWGEGTMIEPSREFGFRDLEVVQQLRRKHIDAGFAATASDLQLPGQLYRLRRTTKQAKRIKQLDTVSERLADRRVTEARAILQELMER